MIRVTIKPSNIDIDPYMKWLTGKTGFTKQVLLIDVSIDGHEVMAGTGGRLPGGDLVWIFDHVARSHPRWAEVVQAVDRQLKRYFEMRDAKE